MPSGRTRTGATSFVAFTLRDKAGRRRIWPLSARYMHRKEIENYERQKGKEA
jgi:uncharacterized DUF497 family protein